MLNAAFRMALRRRLGRARYPGIMMANRMISLAAAMVAATLANPAAAQVRVIVDGQAQEVPQGVIRTVLYQPGGHQTIHDEPCRGQAAAGGAATVTTTETTDEDERGRTIRTQMVTRIAPVIAIAYPKAAERDVAAPPETEPEPEPAPFAPAPPRLEIDPASYEATGEAPRPHTVRIRRDAETGHFIANVRVNGVEIRAIIDTGAASTILSARDAWATGAANAIVSSERMVGIGGYTLLNIAHVRSFEVAGQQYGGMSAAIGQEGLAYTLLGQTEIARLGRIVIEDGTMTITPQAARMASR